MKKKSKVKSLREEPDRRTWKICPLHKRREYGNLVTMYDTVRVFLTCGTMIDYGYGYWQKPRNEWV